MMPEFPELMKEMNSRKTTIKHFDRQSMYFYKSTKNHGFKNVVETITNKNMTNTSGKELDMDKSTST